MGGLRGAVLRLVGFGMLLLLLGVWTFAAGSRNSNADDMGRMTVAVMLAVLLLEVALIAARVFRHEVEGRTWPILVLLPTTQTRIATGKIFGCALGLLPACGYLSLGALLARDFVGDAAREFLSDGMAFFRVNYVLTQLALGLLVTALLSVTWRWSAWPVSIFFAGLSVFMTNVMLFACLDWADIGPRGGAPFFVWCFGAGQAAFMYYWVDIRLRQLAGG
jgi:ABC-type transport system involved in multi-copper enzyme maturation permease subunit